eukprot:6061691-Heterocapsa_arctica.AAC.1
MRLTSTVARMACRTDEVGPCASRGRPARPWRSWPRCWLRSAMVFARTRSAAARRPRRQPTAD